MTFLQLCQALRREAGLAGTGPTTVVSQTGGLGEIVSWINEAWMAIQRLHGDWRWMRETDTVTTTTGDGTYSPTDWGINATFNRWLTHHGAFRCYVTATGQSDEQYLHYLDYDTWRNLYDFGGNASLTGRPVHYTVDPDNVIRLGPKPDSTGYTIKGEYMTKPSEMSLDADTPGMPSEYHMAIVWRALTLYGGQKGAPDAYTRGKDELKPLMFSLEMNQRPRMQMAGPLV